MKKEDLEKIKKAQDGLTVYEFLVNNLEDMDSDDMKLIVDVLDRADRTGQYLASGARYMNALDKDKYDEHIKRMTSLTIDRDREHNYISDLITALYGAEYYDRVKELAGDDNFRRMYKRLFPEGAL